MSYRTTEKSRDACATLAPRARVSRRCRYVGGHVPQPFEQFYRATLRFVVGSRMRRTEVHRLYCSWAAENEQESLNRRQVKRAMVSIGHGLIESNGMYYLDLGLASAFTILCSLIASTCRQPSSLTAVLHPGRTICRWKSPRNAV